jgi:hypothetical protein
MGQRSRAGSSKSSGRGYGIQRHEKAKTKETKQKHQSGVGYAPEINLPLTPKEVSGRTISKLRNLGKQRFALSPFSAYFGPWMRNLREVLSEFESNSIIKPDDQFSKESSQILTNVEFKLDEIRRIEASSREAEEELPENRIMLKQIEREYADKAREVETRKNKEIKRLSNMITSLNEKLDSINRMKTGIFRGFSEKAKAYRQAEAKQEMDSVQGELDRIIRHSDVEQQKLKEDYEKEKQPVLEKIGVFEKEIEDQEIDGSLEHRDNACEALVKAVDSLLERAASLDQSA